MKDLRFGRGAQRSDEAPQGAPPLSKHALSALARLAGGQVPGSEFNAGVNNVLIREGLATAVQMPSPYKYGRSSVVGGLEITDAGRALLKEVQS